MENKNKDEFGKTDCKSALCNRCINCCICHSAEYIKKVRNEDFCIKEMEKKR